MGKAQAVRVCEAWNRDNPIGTPVRYWFGTTTDRKRVDVRETTTRSLAEVSHAGYPVVFLTGVSGYYALDFVESLGHNT